MKIKVCGLKYQENIFDIASLGPDYLGFIFYDKSPRYVDNKLNIDLLNQLPKTIHKVGVFVNSEINYILDKVKNYQLEFVQLHGSESVKYCQELKEHDIKIIKAFQIEKGFDFNKIIPFKKVVDYFLFDTKTSTYGGSGKKFNWDILEAYDNEIPFFLSGGISLEDANTIKNDLLLEKLNIKALDINSCFETLPAVKNTTMVSNFIKKINNEL
jgi:phosphoribosylanthranilate isomerase